MEKIINTQEELEFVQLMAKSQDKSSKLIYFTKECIQFDGNDCAIKITKPITKDKFIDYLTEVKKFGGYYNRKTRSFVFHKDYNGYHPEILARLFHGESLDSIYRTGSYNKNDFSALIKEKMIRENLRGSDLLDLQDYEIKIRPNKEETARIQAVKGYDKYTSYDIERNERMLGYLVLDPEGNYIIRTNLVSQQEKDKFIPFETSYNSLTKVRNEYYSLTYRDINLFCKDSKKLMPLFKETWQNISNTVTDSEKKDEIQNPQAKEDIHQIKEQVQMTLDFGEERDQNKEKKITIKNNGDESRNNRRTDKDDSSRRISTNREDLWSSVKPDDKDVNGSLDKKKIFERGDHRENEQLSHKDEPAVDGSGDRRREEGDSRNDDTQFQRAENKESDRGISQGNTEGKPSDVLFGGADSVRQDGGSDNSRRNGRSNGTVHGDGADFVGLVDGRRIKREKPEGLNANAYLCKESPKVGSRSEVFERNIEIIELLADIVEVNRKATEEEKEKLSTYSGWGGYLDSLYKQKEQRSRIENALDRISKVKQHQNPKFRKDAMMSSLYSSSQNAYFTPNEIIDSIYYFVQKAGFEGGKVLEPSMGTGRFFSSMDKALIQRSQLTGIEKDAITGMISNILYPEANIQINGFEETRLPNNYDLVLSNVPFGNISVYDEEWANKSSIYKGAQTRIHNYFSIKMLEKTAPGGLCVILASNAIMDTPSNEIIRKKISDEAEFLGAVRLPNNTFQATEVTTDIIFLRKFNEGEAKNQKIDFVETKKINLLNRNDENIELSLNQYYVENPSRILGKLDLGRMYGGYSITVTSTENVEGISQKVKNFSDEVLKDRIFEKKGNEEKEYADILSRIKTKENIEDRDGSLVMKDNKIGFVVSQFDETGTMTKYLDMSAPVLKKENVRILSYLELKNTLGTLIQNELEGKEKESEKTRKELNSTYDKFVALYGSLNDKKNANIFKEDVDFVKVKNLEKMDADNKVVKADIFHHSTIRRKINLEEINTPQSAINVSLAEFGYVNTLFLEQRIGSDWKEQTADYLFRIPGTEKYELREIYLSGDVKTKLEEAEKYLSEDRTIQKNVEELKKVIPADIPAEQISIRLGNRWIPDQMYGEFFRELLQNNSGSIKVSYSGSEADTYDVSIPLSEKDNPLYSTPYKNTREVLEAAINDKTLIIRMENAEGDKVVNKEQTCIVNDKIRDIRSKFQDWIIADRTRAQEIQKIYNSRYNRTVVTKFDGSHLNFEGIAITPRPHQKDAVWMVMQRRGGIIDHMVGAGKTLVMESAAMEMKRTGMIKKPLLIGLKANVQQMANEFLRFYPNANILAPTEKDFTKQNRRNLLSKIAVNDYDCIILTHDQYKQLEHTNEIKREVYEEKINELESAILFLENAKDNQGYGTDDLTKRQLKALENRKSNLRSKLNKLTQQNNVDEGFCFENLGFDFLMVDESHKFKNLEYATKYTRVAGLGNSTGSKGAMQLLFGVRSMQKLHGGDNGVVFASGTTITNSIVELYNILQYMRPNEMKKLGFSSFDAWASNYAERSTEFEFSVTGEIKLKDRFRKFLNVPELSLQYTEITDVRNDNNLKLNKPEARLHLVNIQPNEKMQEVNREIIEFAKSGKSEMFGLHLDDKDTSKMLLATTLSAKAAIDLRLVIEDYEEKEGDSGKLTQVVNNVAETYLKFDEHKGTQMIFSDLIENHNTGFSVYSEIKKQLIEKHHIPADQIADIRDYNTDVKRENLFKDMNNGNVRILMGSTSKLGTGVNAQERCVAIHHIDVPWTPSSLDQRNGRGVRQGNQIAKLYNDNKCDVYFYAVERSLDAYKYQLLETKSAFINQVKTNSAQSRDCVEGSGDENEGLSYAEIVAVLSGNPLLLEKSKVDRNVEELTRQRRAFLTNLSQQKDNIETLQIRSTKLTRLIEGNTKDRQKLKENGFVQDKQGLYPITQTINGVKFDKAKEAGEYITREFKDGNPINIEGFGMKSEVHLDPTNLMNRSDQLILTNSEGRIHYSVDFDITSDPTHLGQIFRKLLTSVETNGVSYQNSMEEVKQKQELMKDVDVNAKFPEEEKLNGLLNRQKEITLEFEKEDLEQNDYGTGNVDESEITEEVEGIEESEAEEVEEPSVSYKGGEIEENAAFDAEGKEFTLIERTFSEKQGFDFTGNEKIENAGDIAYLFRNLENSSVENSFGVYQSKEGTTIQYLTTGDDSHTIVPISAMLQGAIAMKADSVTLVHNHPSGSIIPSQMDRDLLAHMKKTFEGRNIKVNDGIIINTRSGKYSTFGSKDGTIEDFRPEKGEKEIPYKVMSFDRLVFSKEYSPDKLDKVRDIQSIVRFISSQRLGERDKMGYVVLDRQKGIVANLFTSETKIDKNNYKTISMEIADKSVRFGGAAVILYGRFEMDKSIDLNKEIKRNSADKIVLCDIIQQNKENSNFISYSDEGYLSPNYFNKKELIEETKPEKAEKEQKREEKAEKKDNSPQSYLITDEMLSHIGSSTIALSINNYGAIKINNYAMKGIIDLTVKADIFIPKTNLDKIQDKTIYVTNNKVTNKEGEEIGKMLKVDIPMRIKDYQTDHQNQRVGVASEKEGSILFSVSTDKIKNIPPTENGNIFLSIKKNREGEMHVYPTKVLYSNALTGIKDFYVRKDILMNSKDATIKINKDGNIQLDKAVVGKSITYPPRYIEHPEQKQEKEQKQEVRKNKGMKI